MKDMMNSSVTLRLNSETVISGENYAAIAEATIEKERKKERESWFDRLSMSKLRGIYGLITNVYTRVNKPDDLEANRGDLQYIKVKMAYEAGRDERTVKAFLNTTGLMVAIDNVKTYDQFILYCRYAESLVAYFKFYGGKE